MLEGAILNRERLIQKLQEEEQWDIIVIGGGATGLGIAVDGASRGYKTLLLEQADFAKGTSSRSTKLVHGGVRYLAQGNIQLVYDALHERGLLLQNAPHLVKRQAFVIPCYSTFSKIKYLVGLKLYDWMSGRFSFGKSCFLNKSEVIKQFPCINKKGLAGGVRYFDGQFDDARLAVNLAQTAIEKGGVLLNYFRVTGLIKKKGLVAGVTAIDSETNKPYTLQSKVVINATGVFVDDVLQMDVPGSRPLVRPSQGVHLVVDKSFLDGSDAMMIPETADGRVLFAVPWHNHILLGTTDTPLEKNAIEPAALESEISFILNTFKRYLSKAPAREDVLSVFAGLRPLAAPKKDTSSTKEISRDHKLIVSDSDLITITGGKWTTYRKMAEETVNRAMEVGKLPIRQCQTKKICIHGSTAAPVDNNLSVYGSDFEKVQQLLVANPLFKRKLVNDFPYMEVEVIWAVRNEMARTVEDVLARRLRLLFLNASAALQAAPRVAELVAVELNKDQNWIEQQVKEFSILASQYLLVPINQTNNQKITEIEKLTA